MRLTFALLGLELDVTFGLATAADEDDPLRDLGTLGSTPISFAPSPSEPAEWQPPERTLPWDEPYEEQR